VAQTRLTRAPRGAPRRPGIRNQRVRRRLHALELAPLPAPHRHYDARWRTRPRKLTPTQACPIRHPPCTRQTNTHVLLHTKVNTNYGYQQLFSQYECATMVTYDNATGTGRRAVLLLQPPLTLACR
jgi:hypothetical protein